MKENIIKTINSINEFETCKSVYSTKIISSFMAYGNYPDIAKFWQGHGGAYCLWGDNLTIDGEANKPFIEFLKPNSIFCSLKTAEKLNLDIVQSGEVLYKKLDGEKQKLNICYSNDINIMYEILKSCEMIEDYESFKLETSHKLRHALGTYELIDNKAIAMSLYSLGNSAIISTVAVLKEFRRKGLGRLALEKLEEKLMGRELYLLKEKDKNDEFYRKQNYKAIDHWCIGKLR